MRKKRILFIDDEASLTRSIKMNLDLLETYEICTENRSRHALETARKFLPDLIFLDVMMPEMDGGDVAAKFEADPLLRRTPIVFLTAILTQEETKGQETRMGTWNYLAKPVDLETLVKCIERHLPK